MYRLIFCIVLGLLYSSPAFACSSDFSCRYGESCVKAPFKSRGVCMKSVDKFGTRTFKAPSTNSIGTRMGDDGCRFSTDCPIGFDCDRRLKVCLKR
jgi:hypothetical protein